MKTANMPPATKTAPMSISRFRWNTVALFLGGALFGSMIAVTVQVKADQPNMETALSSLQAAKQSLQDATPNKGGHREKAIWLTQRAIDETQAGIQFTKRH